MDALRGSLSSYFEVYTLAMEEAFLAVRRRGNELLLLVECVGATLGTGGHMSCFDAGLAATLAQLRARLMPNASEDKCRAAIRQLIVDAQGAYTPPVGMTRTRRWPAASRASLAGDLHHAAAVVLLCAPAGARAGAASRACQARVLPANAGVRRGIVYWAECRRDGLRSRSKRKAARLACKALLYRTRHKQHPPSPASTTAGAHRQTLIIYLHAALMTPYTHGTYSTTARAYAARAGALQVQVHAYTYMYTHLNIYTAHTCWLIRFACKTYTRSSLLSARIHSEKSCSGFYVNKPAARCILLKVCVM